eukprot:1154648-Pelagomonas_calceolata.AAC.7
MSWRNIVQPVQPAVERRAEIDSLAPAMRAGVRPSMLALPVAVAGVPTVLVAMPPLVPTNLAEHVPVHCACNACCCVHMYPVSTGNRTHTYPTHTLWAHSTHRQHS